MKLENVTLAFTQNMSVESTYGGWNYSFIINADVLCDKVRETLSTQKTKQWPDEENTNSNILKRLNAKSREDVTYEPVVEMMKDTDVLVQVKSKTSAIENTENVRLSRGTTADILIDVFEFVYNKKKMICCRSHADRYCTVKVNNLIEFTGGFKGFEMKVKSVDCEAGVDLKAVEDIEEAPF